MRRVPRSLRLAVFAAALLHALVGGWGAWLHGAPPLPVAVVHAADEGGAATAVQPHGADCALCHSAALHKLATGGRPLWPAAADPSGGLVATSLPFTLRAAPANSGDARAPPSRV